MTKAPVLLQGEEQDVCILSGIVDGLEVLIKNTKIEKWHNAFLQCHFMLDAIMQARFLCIKDGGTLKRLAKLSEQVKIGYKVANTDLTRDGEETFKCKVASEDIYTMAEMLQSCKCQNCHEDKGKCQLFGVFNKYHFDKFNDKPDKGVCPYSVILEGGDE